jgi:serine/threonine protein kinase
MIGEGGYGCVYLGNPCEDSMYGASKVVNTRAALREIANGKRIRKIPNYQQYFVPVESSCVVHSEKYKKTCKALRKTDDYMVLTFPYIHTVQTVFDRDKFIEMMPHLAILIKAKMVHFDLKIQNVLLTPKPLIIDFGISIDMKKVYQDLRHNFYVYSPSQYEWPIEVHLLCYGMDDEFTLQSIEEVCHDVYKKNPFLQDLDGCIQHYSYLVKYTHKEAIRRLMHGWKTWDLYAVTLMLFHTEEVDALRTNLHYNPKKRLTIPASRLAAAS